MRAFALAMLICGLPLPGQLNAQSVPIKPTSIQFEDVLIEVPEGWRTEQTARSQDVLLAGFSGAGVYVTLYAREQLNLNMHDIFVNGSTLTRDIHRRTIGDLSWHMLQTTKAATSETPVVFITAFKTELNNKSYYGFARGSSAVMADTAAITLLENLQIQR